MKILNNAADLYGAELSKASRSELASILGAIGLEMESRHCQRPIPDGLADVIMGEGDDDILALAIAVASKMQVGVMPCQ